MKGFMYILKCADDSYYTGSTKNLEYRLQQHNNGEGANHTKKRLPVKLVYYEKFDRIDKAFYREKQVQGWSRKKKEALINREYGKLPELSIAYRDLPSTSRTSENVPSSASGNVPSRTSGTNNNMVVETDTVVEALETTTRYKKTEIGVIPEDWEVKYLGEIAKIIGGGTPSTNETSFWNGDINWFTPTEIGLKKYSYESLRKITKIGLENSSARLLPAGTILLTTRAGIGDISILMSEACTNQGFQSFVVNDSFDNEYIYYLISTLKNTFIQNASGSTFLEISPKKIKAIQIAVPTKAEQKAIAEVLSDTDELIQSLEKKIAKKRLIKQGAMQKLLTPPSQPEALEGWEVKKLGEVAEIRNGYAFKSITYDNNGKYRIITIANVQDGFMDITNCNKITNLPKDIQSHQRLFKGDLLMSMTGNVGRTCIVSENNSLLNQRVGKLIVTDIKMKFFFYLVQDRKFLNQMILNAQGGAQGNIGKNDILGYETYIPLNKSEQTQIATILSDMDNEIEMLENKLTKYKKLKQGMMQELLTGKIRLINN